MIQSGKYYLLPQWITPTGNAPVHPDKLYAWDNLITHWERVTLEYLRLVMNWQPSYRFGADMSTYGDEWQGYERQLIIYTDYLDLETLRRQEKANGAAAQQPNWEPAAAGMHPNAAPGHNAEQAQQPQQPQVSSQSEAQIEARHAHMMAGMSLEGAYDNGVDGVESEEDD
jgi:hypothetical protein